MTKQQLTEWLETGRELEFEYQGRFGFMKAAVKPLLEEGTVKRESQEKPGMAFIS